MRKYRVYEAIDNDGEKFKEHGHFGKLKDAQYYAIKHNNNKPCSTFIVNYSNDKGEVFEQYYGKWTNY